MRLAVGDLCLARRVGMFVMRGWVEVLRPSIPPFRSVPADNAPDNASMRTGFQNRLGPFFFFFLRRSVYQGATVRPRPGTCRVPQDAAKKPLIEVQSGPPAGRAACSG